MLRLLSCFAQSLLATTAAQPSPSVVCLQPDLSFHRYCILISLNSEDYQKTCARSQKQVSIRFATRLALSSRLATYSTLGTSEVYSASHQSSPGRWTKDSISALSHQCWHLPVLGWSDRLERVLTLPFWHLLWEYVCPSRMISPTQVASWTSQS